MTERDNLLKRLKEKRDFHQTKADKLTLRIEKLELKKLGEPVETIS